MAPKSMVQKGFGNSLMENLKEIFTVYIDTSGEPWIKWTKDVPDEWKIMLRSAFGAQFKEIPDSE